MKRIVQFPNKDSQSASYQFSKGTAPSTEFEFNSSTPEQSISVFEYLHDLNYKGLDKYFKNGDPDVLDSAGYSLLNRCVQFNMPRQYALSKAAKHDEKFYDMLVYLLDHGCDLNLVNPGRNNLTALQYVLSHWVGSVDNEAGRKNNEAMSSIPVNKRQLFFKRKSAIIKLLIERGSLNCNDPYGFNPVMFAVNINVRLKTHSELPPEKEYFHETSHLLQSHFSLTINNLIEMNLQFDFQLHLLSVKHGLTTISRTHELLSKLNHPDVKFNYSFVQELSHQFFISEENNIAVNDELKSLLYVMQFFDLANFLRSFRYNHDLRGLGESPLKSSLNLFFTSPQFGHLEIFCVDYFLLFIDVTNTLNWILPYKIVGSISRIEGIFSLFQFLISKPEFDVTQIGPFFIELISRIDSSSELASGIQYLLVRYLILLELWISHRPLDESKVYHLKEDLIQSRIFSFNTLAHYFLQNFNLFDIIRLKTSFPVQRGERCSIWEKSKETKEEESSESHVFMKILECLSFQMNNRDDSERNTCLHILAKLGRVDCMEYTLDYLGAYPFSLNSQGNTFLDIYEGINAEEKCSRILKNIKKFREYMSKPYSLRTLCGYVISKLPDQIIQSINPPHNILHFILLHQKPNPGYDIVELRLTGKYLMKPHRKPKPKNIPDKQLRLTGKYLMKPHRKPKPKNIPDKQNSPGENRITLAAFSIDEGDATNSELPECDLKFNPGII